MIIRILKFLALLFVNLYHYLNQVESQIYEIEEYMVVTFKTIIFALVLITNFILLMILLEKKSQKDLSKP
jgi:hypothetical protein